LTLGLLLSSRDFRTNAERFHACALDLSRIYNELDIQLELFGSPTNVKDYEKFAKKYHSVISKYNINHKKLDFDVFKATNITEFPEMTKIKGFLVHIKYFFCVYFVYLCIIIVPLAVGGMLFL